MITQPYGYWTSYGYMGWVEELNDYLFFATEGEYIDYISTKGEQ